MNRFRILVALAVSLVSANALGAEPVRSLSGVPFAGNPAVAESALRLKAGAPARTIALGAPSAGERSVMQKAAPVTDKRAPLKIGFTREVPAGLQRLDLEKLDWHDVGAATRAAQIVIDSASASAIRAALALEGDPTGLKFRFTGNGPGARVFGPFTWNELVGAGRWSPVMEGSVATLEIEAGPDAALAGTTLVIARISHLEVSGADLAPSRLKRVPNIGTAGSCNIDLACVPNPSNDLRHASSAVAQIAFTGDGGTFLCTGSLLNSTSAAGEPTQVPYFATANHCVGNEAAAATINFYWFFEAATCNSLAVPEFVVTPGGAALLYTSYDVDLTFLRMNNSPPAGAFMAGWDASPVFPGTSLISLHHPQGDLKKFSAGQAVDFAHDFDDIQSAGNFVEQGMYLRVRWSQGTTEQGSSGGGAFTRATSGEYQLRGVLHGGDASCLRPLGLDYFSRLDLAYPSISQYLAGVSQPAPGNNAIEYYNVDLDHYFMTSFPDETMFVESGGAGRGWVRTGYSFPIDANPNAHNSVCRFYGNPAINPATGQRRGPNSHFYTADAAECAFVKLDPGWVYEAIAFSIDVPAGDRCPSGTTPVFRLYNNGFATNNSNHRYTTSRTIYQFMLTQQWKGENTVMCAP